MTTHNTPHTIIEVTLEVASDYPSYGLVVNGAEADFSYRTSRILTNTNQERCVGIFTTHDDVLGCFDPDMGTITSFTRGDVKVEVDLGTYWEPSHYANPALEIKKRVDLVNAAFDLANKSNKAKVWTVEL